MSVADLYRNRGVNPLAVQASDRIYRGAYFAPSADNILVEGEPTTNWGESDRIRATPYTTWIARSILKFDICPTLPSGIVISKAMLRLYTIEGVAGRTIAAYRLLRTDWVETESTWSIYKTGSAWGTAGALDSSADCTTTDAAYAVSVASGLWITLDVTAQVQAAIDTVGAYNCLIFDAGVSAALDNHFASRHHATEAYRPQLLVVGR